jgi:hypothetical protein
MDHHVSFWLHHNWGKAEKKELIYLDSALSYYIPKITKFERKKKEGGKIP